MAQTEAGDIEYKRLQDEHDKGYSYETDLIYENWDKLYGVPPFSYSVYILLDSTRPVRIKFCPYIEVNYQPIYVGHGQFGKRAKKSLETGRQQDKYTFKVARLNEIKARGGKAREVIIGHFLTKCKAHLVERKIMNLPNIRSFLENGELNYCEIPLTTSDCNVICNHTIITL